MIRLNQALKEKRPEWHNRHNKLIMLHDNARPQSQTGQEILGRSKMGNSAPPAVFTDIAPSDFYLFRSMQSALSGERFNSYEDIKKWLDKWIASKEPDFSFEESVYYWKGRKLSLPKEHTLNKLTYIDLF